MPADTVVRCALCHIPLTPPNEQQGRVRGDAYKDPEVGWVCFFCHVGMYPLAGPKPQDPPKPAGHVITFKKVLCPRCQMQMSEAQIIYQNDEGANLWIGSRHVCARCGQATFSLFGQLVGALTEYYGVDPWGEVKKVPSWVAEAAFRNQGFEQTVVTASQEGR